MHLAEDALGVVSIQSAIKVSCCQLAWNTLLDIIDLKAFHTASIDNFFDQVEALKQTKIVMLAKQRQPIITHLLIGIAESSTHGPLEELRLELRQDALADNRDIVGVTIVTGVSLHLIVVHPLLVPLGPDGCLRRKRRLHKEVLVTAQLLEDTIAALKPPILHNLLHGHGYFVKVSVVLKTE